MGMAQYPDGEFGDVFEVNQSGDNAKLQEVFDQAVKGEIEAVHFGTLDHLEEVKHRVALEIRVIRIEDFMVKNGMIQIESLAENVANTQE